MNSDYLLYALAWVFFAQNRGSREDVTVQLEGSDPSYNVSLAFTWPDLKLDETRSELLAASFRRFIVPRDRNRSSDTACDFAPWRISRAIGTRPW